MQAPPPLHGTVNAATGSVTPVKVEFAGVAQSTWKRHSRRLFDPNSTIGFREPAGGGVGPSTSPGTRLPWLVDRVKHCCVAGWPTSIFDRSRAHIAGPEKALPFRNRLTVR